MGKTVLRIASMGICGLPGRPKLSCAVYSSFVHCDCIRNRIIYYTASGKPASQKALCYYVTLTRMYLGKKRSIHQMPINRKKTASSTWPSHEPMSAEKHLEKMNKRNTKLSAPSVPFCLIIIYYKASCTTIDKNHIGDNKGYDTT